MKLNIKVFYKLIPSFLVAISRHRQGTQNNKFPVSLQYLKKNESNKVEFLHATKQETFQNKSILSGLVSKASHAQNTENNKFAISQEWSSVLIKLCHGNNLVHMVIKDC